MSHWRSAQILSRHQTAESSTLTSLLNDQRSMALRAYFSRLFFQRQGKGGALSIGIGSKSVWYSGVRRFRSNDNHTRITLWIFPPAALVAASTQMQQSHVAQTAQVLVLKKAWTSRLPGHWRCYRPCRWPRVAIWARRSTRWRKASCSVQRTTGRCG